MIGINRNVRLLSVAQALMMSATSLIITSSALVGAALAPTKALATLPLALQFIAIMLTSIPAAMLLKRLGRRQGFRLSTILGLSGGALATTAIITQSFWLFALGTMLVGSFNAFANYYRFTAADSVDTSNKSRAISWVLAGGVIAALIGPNLANLAKDWITSAPFAGSYAAMTGLYVLSFITLSFLRLPEESAAAAEATEEPPARTLKTIASQPRFIVALACGMLGYATMSFLMTATPLSMQHHNHNFSDTAFVIQWHVLGMFVPSFFTGSLIARFGVLRIMTLGAIFGLLCITINLLGTSLWHFWLALLLLGVSWNFLFIGATTLLTETYQQNERARAQSINDFAIFSCVALASLSAGTLQHLFGWAAVNMGSIPILLVILSMLAWLSFQEKPKN